MDDHRTGWVEANGVSLRVRREGSGLPIVLMHEMGGALESWDLVTSVLTLRYDVISFDLRGSGLSEKIRAPVTLATFVADLASLLDVLALRRVIVVGVALGGGIALAFAKSHPDRVLGVVGFAPETGVPIERRAHAATFPQRLTKTGVSTMIDEAMIPSAWPDIGARRGRAFAIFRGLQKAADPQSSAFQNAMLIEADTGAFACSATVPTHIVAGRFDPMRGPTIIRDFARHVPHAIVREADTGHFMALQAPNLIIAEIDALVAEANLADGSSA